MATDKLEQWKARFVNEGVERGHEQGMKEALCTLYRSRFGELPPAMAGAILATHDLATLTRWVALIGTGSSADVAAALGQANGSPPGSL
jgi:hypothetical protein